MISYSKSVAGFRFTHVGHILTISFLSRIIFIKVGSDWKFCIKRVGV